MNGPTDDTVRPRFESLGESGVLVDDPIDNVRFAFHSASRIAPRAADPDEFLFPVDAAVSFRTSALTIPSLVNVIVRDRTGDIVADYSPNDGEQRLPDTTHYLELSSTPMKLYLVVERGEAVRRAGDQVRVDLDGEETVRIGARSFHEGPAGTVTVTDDVRDAMDAVSLLGSALKTTDCERSFQTLRGHPPLVERGETFSVPDGVERPATDVRLVLPADRDHVYPAASLAYYLGAEVGPGTDPRLVAGDFEYALDGPEGYESTVNRVLRRVVFLDCLTRTEGYYAVDLHERQRVEPLVDLDFGALYDRPIAAQVREYLSVPYETLAPHVPEWPLTTDVVPVADNVDVLPFAARELSLVRCPDEPSTASSTSPPGALADFYRGPANDDPPTENVVRTDPVETSGHAWVGDGYPLGGDKLTADACRRRVERAVPDQSTIEIRVVCNDPAMKAEGVVNDLYGFRDLLEYDVDIDYGLSTDELADLLGSSVDFLHYIGHVDDDGIRCPDGVLDARTLDDVGVEAFLLNACRSYEQAAALVEKGSYAGVATLSDVSNDLATEVGQILARLLNCGYTLRDAVAVARDQVLTGYRYITIGDGGVELCQTNTGVALRAAVERGDAADFELELRAYATPGYGIGTMYLPYVGDLERRYLSPGVIDTFEMSADELDDYLDITLMPVEFEGDRYWSEETSVADLRSGKR